MRIHIKKLRVIGGAVGALLTTTALVAPASAGGFGVREQSTEFQGMSFAGNATSGGGLSGMFWNPAVAAYAPVGLYSESGYAVIFGNVEMTGDVFAGGVNLGLPRESGDIAKDAIVPSSYYSYRLNEHLVAAISINSPFGLVTEPSNRNWAGQTFARTSEIKTYNFTPTLAYRLSPTLAIGVGLQINHMEGRLKNASGLLATSPNFVIKGDDLSVGFTAGINFTPHAGTHIGLGYRSAIDHTLEGNVFLAAAAPFTGAMKADITLPEIVTLSLRQVLSPTWTLLGTVEWSNWSRLDQVNINCPGTALCPTGVRTLDLGWNDGWFFSLGAEHQYNEKLTLRAGLAYEISPIQDADERTLRTPDMDRLWLSVGGSYKWSDATTFDLAYTHIFGIGDDKIDRTEGGVRFIGNVDSQVDIVSFGMKMKLGGDHHDYKPMK